MIDDELVMPSNGQRLLVTVSGRALRGLFSRQLGLLCLVHVFCKPLLFLSDRLHIGVTLLCKSLRMIVMALADFCLSSK